MRAQKTHVIVVGNEKGGTGKSTVSFNLSLYLAYQGFDVATIDVDSRQQTLTRYVQNRSNWMRNRGVELPETQHYHLPVSRGDSLSQRNETELELFRAAIGEVDGVVDFIIIDSPGFDTNLARLSHTLADTLITPLNDSFIDLDVVAQAWDGPEQLTPSHYSRLVQRARRERTKIDGASIDWILLRNRVAPLMTRNMRMVQSVLEHLASELGARLAPSITERTIYRSLFPSGLTAFDPPDLVAQQCSTDALERVRAEYERLYLTLGLQTDRMIRFKAEAFPEHA